jgi:hypothetical protein
MNKYDTLDTVYLYTPMFFFVSLTFILPFVFLCVVYKTQNFSNFLSKIIADGLSLIPGNTVSKLEHALVGI